VEELNLVNVQPDVKKLCVIGPEGSGKTHFIGTMPKPIYLFSFDGGYRTLAGVAGIQVGSFMDSDRYRPQAYAQFKLKFDEFKNGKMQYTWPDGRQESYKTVGFDSITALSKSLLDHEQAVNHTIDKPGGFGVWGNVKSKLSDVVCQSALLAEYAVFTAQIESEKDDLTGEVFFKPSTEGSFRNEMGQWVDAVFFMKVDKDLQGNKSYVMLTVGDIRQKAKIRLPSRLGNAIEAVEVPDFEVLTRKINANKGTDASPKPGTTVGVSPVPLTEGAK